MQFSWRNTVFSKNERSLDGPSNREKINVVQYENFEKLATE